MAASWIEDVCIAAWGGARDADAQDAAARGASSAGAAVGSARDRVAATVASGADAVEDELLRWPRQKAADAAEKSMRTAARSGDGDVVAALCAFAEPDADRAGDGGTALHHACYYGRWQAVAGAEI